jgi:hypothetical protein
MARFGIGEDDLSRPFEKNQRREPVENVLLFARIPVPGQMYVHFIHNNRRLRVQPDIFSDRTRRIG